MHLKMHFECIRFEKATKCYSIHFFVQDLIPCYSNLTYSNPKVNFMQYTRLKIVKKNEIHIMSPCSKLYIHDIWHNRKRKVLATSQEVKKLFPCNFWNFSSSRCSFFYYRPWLWLYLDFLDEVILKDVLLDSSFYSRYFKVSRFYLFL